MFQRVTRSLAAPLALLLGSIAAPPSRADFILYIANGEQSGQTNPPFVKVTSDHQYTEYGFNPANGLGGFNDYGVAVDSSRQLLFIDENSYVYEKDLNFNTKQAWPNSGEWAMALGPKGNLFVGSNNVINEITPGDSTVTPVSNRYGYLYGLAIDSTGNVYVSGNGNNYVEELDPTFTTVEHTYPQTAAWGVAIDPVNGHLFVGTDSHGGGVREFDTTTGSTIPIHTFTGFTNPRSLAFDSSGDLFVGDEGDATIYEISATNVLAGISTKSTFASGHGISQPDQLAIFEPQTPAVAMEPSSLTLLGMGSASLAVYRWRRRPNV